MLNIVSHWENVNQTTLRYHLTPTGVAVVDASSEVVSFGEDGEKLEPQYTASCSGKHLGSPSASQS